MPSEKPTRDVILTTLHRVNYEYASTFLTSLRLAGYRGEIVFFVSALAEETIARLEQDGIRIVRFNFTGKKVKQRLAKPWPVWRLLFQSRLPAHFKAKLAHAVFHLFYRRHLLYLEYLQSHHQDYDRVFLTDARDVYFQADPFSWNPPRGVHVFLEELTIGSCNLHGRWLTSQFGRPAAALRAKTISCAGTVFGDLDGIMQYLTAMVSLMMSARSLREDAGDQGIHNYLVYQQPFAGLTLHDNQTGPVLTMGTMPATALRFDTQNRIVNNRGVVIPVLHQYNRLPEVEKILLARLGSASAGA